MMQGLFASYGRMEAPTGKQRGLNGITVAYHVAAFVVLLNALLGAFSCALAIGVLRWTSSLSIGVVRG